jgi:hypothetical protein
MSAKVLHLDIECSPILVHAWSLRDLHVGLNQIISDPEIIGVGYKWDDKPSRYASKWDEGGRLGMLEQTHALLDEADVLVHYNGQSFDVPWMNGELAREGFTPPAPFKNIDLYKVVRKNFRLPSYKLDYVAGVFLGEHKLPTGGHQLWVDCMNGDENARRKMARYCRRDVDLLPRLLEKLRPWLPNTINFALYNGEELACQKCGGVDLESRGTAYTATRAYPQYRCRDCGGWTRDTRSEMGTRAAGVAR